MNNQVGEYPEEKKAVYLVITDVVGSCDLDRKIGSNGSILKWRDECFKRQLSKLLTLDEALALKSIGDALFIIYEVPYRSELENRKLATKILNYLWKAFDEVKTKCIIEAQGTPYDKEDEEKLEVKIRAVVDRIEGCERGKKIAEHLEKLKQRRKKLGNIDFLKLTMAKDVFGNEVNRAARILSLVRQPAVLVSDDVAKQIKEDTKEYAKKGKPIPIKRVGKDLILHSPVPVLYIKGISDTDEDQPREDSENANGNGTTEDKQNEEVVSSYIVWQLGKEKVNAEAVLAPEFKQNQAFRIINTFLKKPISGGEDSLETKRKKILCEASSILGLDNPSLEFLFYCDFLWLIEDYYIFRNPSFDRDTRDRINSEDYFQTLGFLTDDKPLTRKKGDPANTQKYRIKGQLTDIIITTAKEAIRDIDIIRREKAKKFFNPILVFTSHPDVKHRSRVRKDFFSKKREISDDDIISALKGVSIPLYKGLRFNLNIFTKIPLSNKPRSEFYDGFSRNNCNILLLFQVYFDSLEEGDSQALFAGLDSDAVNHSGLYYLCSGLTPGIMDGFVIYDTDNWKDGVDSILQNLIIPEPKVSFYKKIRPIAIFILEYRNNYFEGYYPLKKNLQYLIKVKELIDKGKL